MEKEQRYFPFFVDISEYRVLVVGAGIIALRRTSALLRFGTRDVYKRRVHDRGPGYEGSDRDRCGKGCR